jgi:hypothetical protein
MVEENAGMNLEDFITEVLKQVISGVKNAQQHAKENGASINSKHLYRYSTPTGMAINTDQATRKPMVEEIEFDVAVTASSQGNIKGGMGLFVSVAGIGYQAEKNTGNSTVSRIKFKIPVSFPQQND